MTTLRVSCRLVANNFTHRKPIGSIQICGKSPRGKGASLQRGYTEKQEYPESFILNYYVLA